MISSARAWFSGLVAIPIILRLIGSVPVTIVTSLGKVKTRLNATIDNLKKGKDKEEALFEERSVLEYLYEILPKEEVDIESYPNFRKYVAHRVLAKELENEDQTI